LRWRRGIAVFGVSLSLGVVCAAGACVVDDVLSVYVTLGVFLLLAIRDPSANRSLIAFTARKTAIHEEGKAAP
jgi:hypothetical protein